MSDDTPSPTPPFDDELRETVELMSKVVARTSDRVDAQTKVLKDLDGTLAEVRSATFLAAEQTDPKRYGELVGATIDGKINDNLVRMGQMCVDLLQASNRARDVLAKAEEDKSIALRQLWEREKLLDQWKSRWPLFGLAALFLTLAMTVTLPWLLATNKYTCQLMVGYTWTMTTTGTTICVRYNE
ncbi:hypothetical protein [Roseivivax sp. THAF197b]|uniref:hypothetical protein n=1 Tax=Roseivivax sp. THAF197b TaxID=2588299 RepID=UPI0012681C42|nr:hypothetical protein [Roseivivax sp. THAF197b]QFS85202.1 hypothetical protein FIV09_20325 [Roseivivax sp. THAF197b]